MARNKKARGKQIAELDLSVARSAEVRGGVAKEVRQENYRTAGSGGGGTTSGGGSSGSWGNVGIDGKPTSANAFTSTGAATKI